MKIDEMRDINARQKQYYEVASGGETHGVNSRATNLYRRLRKRLFAGIPRELYNSRMITLHKKWIGNISNMRVLDLGCGSGNPLSVWLAENAKEYMAIDLSESRIEELRKKLPKKYSVHAIAGDVLDGDLGEEKFDLVYALAVFHHFKYFDEFLEFLRSMLNPGATIIAHDPLQIWTPARAVRLLYRPFQTDRDWEFPFTRTSLGLISKHFIVEDVQGMMRRSKWAMLVGLALPSVGARLGERAIEREFDFDRSLHRLSGCLQVSLKLRNPS